MCKIRQMMQNKSPKQLRREEIFTGPPPLMTKEGLQEGSSKCSTANTALVWIYILLQSIHAWPWLEAIQFGFVAYSAVAICAAMNFQEHGEFC